MATDDPQKIWDDYFERKKSQRIEEASKLWVEMRSAGVGEETVLALDFLHFGTSRESVEALASQLAESYSMQVVPAKEEGVWQAKGTTRRHPHSGAACSLG